MHERARQRVAWCVRDAWNIFVANCIQSRARMRPMHERYSLSFNICTKQVSLSSAYLPNIHTMKNRARRSPRLFKRSHNMRTFWKYSPVTEKKNRRSQSQHQLRIYSFTMNYIGLLWEACWSNSSRCNMMHITLILVARGFDNDGAALHMHVISQKREREGSNISI